MRSLESIFGNQIMMQNGGFAVVADHSNRFNPISEEFTFGGANFALASYNNFVAPVVLAVQSLNPSSPEFYYKGVRFNPAQYLGIMVFPFYESEADPTNDVPVSTVCINGTFLALNSSKEIILSCMVVEQFRYDIHTIGGNHFLCGILGNKRYLFGLFDNGVILPDATIVSGGYVEGHEEVNIGW